MARLYAIPEWLAFLFIVCLSLSQARMLPPARSLREPSRALHGRQSPAPPPPPPPPPRPQAPPAAPWRHPNLLYQTYMWQNYVGDPRNSGGNQRMQMTVERADGATGPSDPNYQQYRTSAESYVGRIMRAARQSWNTGGRTDQRAPVTDGWVVQPALGYRMDFQLLNPAGIQGAFAFEFQDIVMAMNYWMIEMQTNSESVVTDGQVVIRWFLPESEDTDPGHVTPQLASGEAVAVMRISRTVGANAQAPSANPPAALLSLDRTQRSNTLTSRSKMGGFIFPGVGSTINKWMRDFSEL